jgi:hypothetical protein
MKLDRLEQARFPSDPSRGFADRVLAAARRQPRLIRPPSLLPEFLDGLGWAAAVWVGGFLLREFLR